MQTNGMRSPGIRILHRLSKGSGVKVIQTTRDEAKGLLLHAREGPFAHHSPDIFHVLKEATKATAGALSAKIRHAEKHVGDAEKKVRGDGQKMDS
jgi:hypothetical protein